ncbi:MAG: hypothetical protein SRB2_01358 [Desulfobacteraceae bacterium Eth-SRB2]|nr:MAG: hypothetical protein SRB2_01358 [Desulfobacteraceae bacterium Eth-SRB2]
MTDASARYSIKANGKSSLPRLMGDCGLTGRKISLILYGGYGIHGGCAFPQRRLKVDRSGSSYTARQ